MERNLTSACKQWIRQQREHTCERCHVQLEEYNQQHVPVSTFELHHIVPVHFGIEDNSLGNLRLLCPPCHDIEDGRAFCLETYLQIFDPQIYARIQLLIG